MVSQSIMIGIAIGVFFAGLGVGYAVLQSTVPATPMMTSQQMQQMMNDPQATNQWMNTMMQDPQLMNQWMGTMMNDPQLQQQMMNMMMQNQGMMNTMMSNQQMMNMMDSQMMNQGMMGGNMMGQMMGSTVTQQDDVLSIITNIEKILDQISTNYENGNQNIAFSLATNAYLENYEYIEGAIAQKDRPLMEKIELMMRVDLRSMIKNGDSVEKVNMKIDSIKRELNNVKPLFQ